MGKSASWRKRERKREAKRAPDCEVGHVSVDTCKPSDPAPDGAVDPGKKHIPDGIDHAPVPAGHSPGVRLADVMSGPPGGSKKQRAPQTLSLDETYMSKGMRIEDMLTVIDAQDGRTRKRLHVTAILDGK